MTTSADATHCDLCIVGAGYAALNGLNAAAKYLKRGARVVVIDKRETWGGQWLHQYEFVRLHQPYRMFTAGDQPWTLQRDPSYLATRREVLDHLGSVPSISAGHLELTPFFRHAYTHHTVRAGQVDIIAQPIANAGAATRIRAKRLLIATGTDIEPLPPLSLSSTHIRSIAVSDPLLNTPEFLQSNAPVYIIGGGKTAMDCALHLAQTRRSITVVAGSGMYFLSRDNLCPRGLRRYYGGSLNAETFLTMCELFDGHNEQTVMQHMERLGQVHTVWGFGGNYRVAMLSNSERDRIRAGVDHVLRGHLLDVEGSRMIWRQGRELREQQVPEGAYFINCTSHLRPVQHQPLLQDGGLVCAPQFALGLSGSSAYHLTHLWFRDRLSEIAPKLLRMRLDTLRLRFVFDFGLMALANALMASERLPPKILLGFRGEVANWYPFYRRIPLIAKLLRRRHALLEKAERFLPLRFTDAPDTLNTRAMELGHGLRGNDAA